MTDRLPIPPAPLRLERSWALWREVDGEVVLLDRTTWRYRSVNRTGAVLWPLLENGARREELVCALTERFEVEPDRAEEDVEAFLSELRRLGLLPDRL